MLREVAWVVFDEVHYMQDRERGVVWEESIIFLPKDIHMVLRFCARLAMLWTRKQCCDVLCAVVCLLHLPELETRSCHAQTRRSCRRAGPR